MIHKHIVTDKPSGGMREEDSAVHTNDLATRDILAKEIAAKFPKREVVTINDGLSIIVGDLTAPEFAELSTLVGSRGKCFPGGFIDSDLSGHSLPPAPKAKWSLRKFFGLGQSDAPEK